MKDVQNMDEKYLESCTIYKVVHGSRAYGTHRPDSDYDEKGIAVIKDRRYYFGFERFEQKDSGWNDGNDRVIYDLRKFFRLALKCNPNIVEVLFVDSGQILTITESGKMLLAEREMFLSKMAAKTFGGFAIAQLKRMQHKEKAGKGINWKHAYHLIRLLRMGQEILLEGKVIVKRPDAADLLEIRDGKWEYKEVVRQGEELLIKLNEAEKKSALPDGPDIKKAEKLMMEIYRRELFGTLI